jgi:hypothetical protein
MRGDQGVDALDYTERTGTASNDLAGLLGLDAATAPTVSYHPSVKSNIFFQQLSLTTL